MSSVERIEIFMDEYTLTEFAIFYKRLMVVENCLKNLIISKYTYVYGDNAYNILYRYFHTLDIQRKFKEQKFKNINISNKSNNEKLILSVNKMYLGEILNIFSNPVFLKNRKVSKIFFPILTLTNNTEFQQKQKALKDFRNCIAHGNEKKYYLERSRMIKGLVFFEKILQCGNAYSFDILDKVSNFRKLSVKEILSIMYDVNKSWFKDDKMLIIIFDDIALINGYTFKSLPQRWTIIRQKFEIEKQVKNDTDVTNIIKSDNQMHIDFNKK